MSDVDLENAEVTSENVGEVAKARGWARHRHSRRPLTPGRKAWFRQKGESVQAYEAFMTYLMLPTEERRIRRAAEIIGKSYDLFQKWSQMWSWRDRVAAYEEHYMLIRLESVEAERDLMYREQKLAADLGMQIVSEHFETLIQQMAVLDGEGNPTGEKQQVVKADALVRMFDTAAKVQRMAVLGRISGAQVVAENQEKLAERYSDELASLISTVINDLGLTAEQQERAKEVLAAHLSAGGEQK